MEATEPEKPNEPAETAAANELLPNNDADTPLDPSLAKTTVDDHIVAAVAVAPPVAAVAAPPVSVPEVAKVAPMAAKPPARASASAPSSTMLKKGGRKRKKTGMKLGISQPSMMSDSATGDGHQLPGIGLGAEAGAWEGGDATATGMAAAATGASDRAAVPDEDPTVNNSLAIAARDKQTIPEDTSGLKRLNSFCTKFRSKRKKRNKNGRENEGPAPEPATEAALQDPDATAGNAVSAGPVVQIINGEIVLQESSMVVTGSTRPDEEFAVVEEEMQLAVVGASYNSFVTRRKPQHWSVEETELFYDALRQVGTDFGTMEAYFGSQRTRKQLKRKYQIESVKNPQLIDLALDPSSMKKIGT